MKHYRVSASIFFLLLATWGCAPSVEVKPPLEEVPYVEALPKILEIKNSYDIISTAGYETEILWDYDELIITYGAGGFKNHGEDIFPRLEKCPDNPEHSCGPVFLNLIVPDFIQIDRTTVKSNKVILYCGPVFPGMILKFEAQIRTLIDVTLSVSDISFYKGDELIARYDWESHIGPPFGIPFHTKPYQSHLVWTEKRVRSWEKRGYIQLYTPEIHDFNKVTGYYLYKFLTDYAIWPKEINDW